MKKIITYSKFNEELNTSTYQSAAQKLSRLGHKRRSGEMTGWVEELKKREKLAAAKEKIDQYSKFGAFNLEYRTSKYSTSLKTYQSEIVCEGNFFIQPSFDSSWFQDMFSDWMGEGRGGSLGIYLEFSTIPADEETRNAFELNVSKLSQKPDNELLEQWGTRMWLKIADENGDDVAQTPNIFWESYDNDIFTFSKRGEAIRFKNLLADAIEGKNNWGFRQYQTNGIPGEWQRMISRVRQYSEFRDELPKFLSMESLPKIANLVRRASVNNLYRN